MSLTDNDLYQTAFPVPMLINPNGDMVPVHEAGMTLRDYFASVALIGLHYVPEYGEKAFDDLARVANKQADAMLAERKKAAVNQ